MNQFGEFESCLQVATIATDITPDTESMIGFLDAVRKWQETIGETFVTESDIERFRRLSNDGDGHARKENRQRLYDYLDTLGIQLAETAKLRKELPSWWTIKHRFPSCPIVGAGDIEKAARFCLELIRGSQLQDETDEAILNLRRCCFEWLPSGHAAQKEMTCDIWSDETPDQWELRVLKTIAALSAGKELSPLLEKADWMGHRIGRKLTTPEWNELTKRGRRSGGAVKGETGKRWQFTREFCEQEGFRFPE